MARPADVYPTTLWTQTVHGTRTDDPARRDAAWRGFLRAYRAPIEQTLRARLRLAALRARTTELVDEFFSYLAAGDVLARADRAYGPFRRFIQGVVRNYVFDLVRAAREGESLDAGAGLEAADLADTAEDIDEAAWCKGMVHAALATLAVDNVRQASALARRYGIGCLGGREGEEATPAVIAGEIGATPHAVHELLRRGKRELRSVLARKVADSIYAGDAAAYREGYARERAHLEAHVRAAWPELVDEGAP